MAPRYSSGALVLALVSVLAPACSKPADNAGGSTTVEAASTAPAPGALMPRSAHEPSAAAVSTETVTGTVEETMDAASYTYVRVKGPSQEVWAASSQFAVKVGDRVTVPLENPMENFHSKALNRDFPVIYFAQAIAREGDQAPAGMPPGHPPVGGTVKGPVAVEKTAPPEGGSAIETVWKDKAALAGKSVTIRGTVVKFNGGILDRNWIHLQDGSGDAKAGTHDITVTTSADARVGDVVTITGTLVLNKDFGSGYAYPAMIENATIKK